jgi:hypothetical protein
MGIFGDVFNVVKETVETVAGKAAEVAEETVETVAGKAAEVAEDAYNTTENIIKDVDKTISKVDETVTEVVKVVDETISKVDKKVTEVVKAVDEEVERTSKRLSDGLSTSKEVDYFVYLSGQSFKVKVSSPKKSQDTFSFKPKNNLVGQMQTGNRKIEMSDINVTEELSGKFEIEASKDNSLLLQKYAEIIPSTGGLNGSNMGNMLETTSIIENDFAVSYGFYDAGVGEKHQAYMYVTDNYSNWMAQLIREMPELESQPFGTFVLPGSHDAGMFTGICSDEEAKDFINKLPDYVFYSSLFKDALKINTSIARRIIINFAYTQKDNIETQLKLGIRYFDFRPGYNAGFYRTDTDYTLRHQHACIPGYEFENFLGDVVSFLKTHEKEIVVVSVNYSGFLQDDMEPTQNKIDQVIKDVFEKHNSDIIPGKINDLKKTVQELLNTKTRLIFLYEKDNKDCCRNSYDTYDPKRSEGDENCYYITDDVNQITTALELTFNHPKPKVSQEKDWTILQLQGTCNATLDGVKNAILTLSDASSPLLSTKARFDYKTYDWVSSHASSRCGNNLLVLLNDFVDNALVSHAMAITRQRLGYK